jgi:hypothetical protein
MQLLVVVAPSKRLQQQRNQTAANSAAAHASGAYTLQALKHALGVCRSSLHAFAATQPKNSICCLECEQAAMRHTTACSCSLLCRLASACSSITPTSAMSAANSASTWHTTALRTCSCLMHGDKKPCHVSHLDQTALAHCQRPKQPRHQRAPVSQFNSTTPAAAQCMHQLSNLNNTHQKVVLLQNTTQSIPP